MASIEEGAKQPRARPRKSRLGWAPRGLLGRGGTLIRSQVSKLNLPRIELSPALPALDREKAQARCAARVGAPRGVAQR